MTRGSTPSASGPNVTVLVVDDAPAGRYVTSRVMTAAGFRVVEAATGAETLAKAAEGVDLVVLDVNLPDLDGFEVCRRLKADRGTASVPVLHLSATYVRPEDRATGLEGGADAYLTSPADPAELIATVNALLRMYRAERAVKRAADEWEATFDALQDGVCLLSPEGLILRCNAAFARLTGEKDEAELGRLFLGHAVTKEGGGDCLLDEVKNAGGRVATDVGFAGRQLTVTMDPVHAEDGAFAGAVTVVSDITARVLAEEALRESEARFRATFDEAPVGIAHVGLDGAFLMVNKAYCSISGYGREEMLGLTFQDITHPDDLEEDLANVQRLLSGEVEAYSMEKRYTRKDGQPIWVNLTVSLMRSETGRPKHFVAVVEDTSVRRRLEDQLRHSQKMEAVGRLAGGVAHDFNNVLTAIAGYADLLSEEMAGDDPRSSDVDEIRLATDRAASLTRQLLAFSRRQVTTPVVLDPNETVTGMERMLRRLIGEDIELVTRLAPGIGSVRADQGQLEQVVLNLAVNSRDAMPQGGRLQIETRAALVDQAEAELLEVRPGDYVRLTVTDDGHGMDEHTLSRLFEPFFTTKESGRGTGLGLATVYAIVTQTGGGIQVQSEVGAGTTVQVLLPRVEEAAASAQQPAPPAARGGEETILLVEDDQALRSLARRVLAGAGYDVLEAEDGRAAIELAHGLGRPIHLLLSDMVMPRLSGRELTRSLLAERPELGIVLMSGYTEEAVTEDSLGRKVTFLAKPFLPSALLQAVRETLDGAGD